MTLYEITDNYRNFFDAVEAGEIPEEAISGTLEAIEGEFNSKVENIACMIKNWQSLAKSQKDEADKLMGLSKGNKNRAARRRGGVVTCMDLAGKKKVETSRCEVTVRKGQKIVQVDDANFIDWAQGNNRDDLLTYKAPTPSKTAIKEAMASGESIPYAEIVTGKDSVTIK